MRKTFIYGLKEPNGEIRYVGKTDDIKRRLRQHKSNARKEKSHKINWIKSCLDKNIEINIVILEEVNYDVWQKREIYWISQFDNLTNHDKGGKGGKPIKYKLSYDDCKKWVSEYLSNVNSQNEWRKNMKCLPTNIPQYPADTYKYRGWISWGDFLGTNRIADQHKNFLTYIEAKEYLKKNYSNIKTSVQYHKTTLPKFLHTKPEKKYINEWLGWNDYLNSNSCKRFNFVDYNQFKTWLNTNYPSFKSNHKYKQLVLEDKIPTFIPKNPKTAYKNKGWVGWFAL